MKKYSKRFERDFEFYTKNINVFTFFGGYPPIVKLDSSGYDAKKCFFIHESTGKLKPTSEVKLLENLLVCKKSVNFHIKMWAGGYAEWTLLHNDLKDIENKYKCPSWVIKAVENQGRRIRYSKNYSGWRDPLWLEKYLNYLNYLKTKQTISII